MNHQYGIISTPLLALLGVATLIIGPLLSPEQVPADSLSPIFLATPTTTPGSQAPFQYPSLFSALPIHAAGAGLGCSYARRFFEDILRFLAGGCLGNFIWYRLFGYLPPFLQSSGCWPPGLLDLTAVFSLGFLGYHLIAGLKKKVEPPPPTPDYLQPIFLQPVELTVSTQAAPGLAQIQATDPDFSLPAFGDFVRQTIRTLYTNWNQRELDKLDGLLSEELLHFLRMAQQIMNLREETHRLENVSLQKMTVAEAGQEELHDFIVVWLQGRIIDYVVQRRTLKLLAGSMTYPKEWEEFWRFERTAGRKSWLLTDIKEF